MKYVILSTSELFTSHCSIISDYWIWLNSPVLSAYRRIASGEREAEVLRMLFSESLMKTGNFKLLSKI